MNSSTSWMGRFEAVCDRLESLRDAGEPIKIGQLARSFGDSTAFTVGFENSTGDTILVLPAHYRVEPAEVSRMLDPLGKFDVVAGYRNPRIDPVSIGYRRWCGVTRPT
jgi:glycosyltransferase involved in cell wall biosynthesis